MNKKQYRMAYSLMRGIGATRAEQTWGENAYDWEEYQKIGQRLDELDWDLMAACGHNIDVRDHIEQAYAQRPVQPRRGRFFKSVSSGQERMEKEVRNVNLPPCTNRGVTREKIF